VTTIGTSCRFCSRFWAVTMMSSIVVGPSWAAAAPAKPKATAPMAADRATPGSRRSGPMGRQTHSVRPSTTSQARRRAPSWAMFTKNQSERSAKPSASPNQRAMARSRAPASQARTTARAARVHSRVLLKEGPCAGAAEKSRGSGVGMAGSMRSAA